MEVPLKDIQMASQSTQTSDYLGAQLVSNLRRKYISISQEDLGCSVMTKTCLLLQNLPCEQNDFFHMLLFRWLTENINPISQTMRYNLEIIP